MRIKYIEMLIAVTEAGSIRAAAEQLGKSQSALTKQLRQLEDELGLPLFSRTSRGVFPTDMGLKLLTRTRSIKAEVSRFTKRCQASRECKPAMSGSVLRLWRR